MGQCSSRPQVEDTLLTRAGSGPAGGAGDGSVRTTRSATDGSKRSGSMSREVTMRMELIGKVHALQQELALLGSPLLAVPEAAELLLDHLHADVIGIYGFPDEGPPCAALLAAHGSGAALLERAIVVRGCGWSACRLAARLPEDGGRLAVADASKPKEPLPEDFQLLYKEAGMHSLTATAIGPPGREPLGVMLLGKLKPGGFDDAWSEVWLSAAATGLLHHMRPGQVAQASSILRTIDEADDPVTAISVLLQSGAKFMFRAVNIAMGVRLALIDESGRTALVFESAKAARRKVEPLLEAGKTVAPPANPGCDVTVRELPLQNTLLASAVSQKKARFVKDCASYMQNCPAPARDVFTHATELVSSVVVVPLLVGDAVLGALYFTQDTPCDFSNIQDALLGFVHAVTLALHNKLAGQMAQMRAMLKTANRPSRGGSDSQPNSQATNPVIRQLETSESEDAADHDPSDDQEPPSPEDSVPPLSQSGASGGRLSKISSRRLCTEGMLRSLQQEIRKGKRRSVELSFMANQLMIYEPIGRGGFGRVYRGSWHKRPAAIKVMNARATDSEAVSDAMEMAVLSTVNHPNIVQVYSCLTDMVEAPGLGGAAAGGKTVPFYRRMLPGEDEDQPTYNIVVMEFMDRGTLGEQVKRAGLFHRHLPDGSIGVDLASVVDILIDVATALQYLHGIKLLHGDVKLDNILLKTDPLRPAGFVPKLADFGLAKMIKDTDEVINHTGAGTVTHLAPEMFKAGSQLTTAVDVYAFGVLMWEFYTAKRPWHGLSPEAIMDRVARKGLRPSFPAGAPADYARMARACLAPSPSDRPALSEVVAGLTAMSDMMAAAGDSPGGPHPPGGAVLGARGACAASAPRIGAGSQPGPDQGLSGGRHAPQRSW